MDAVDITISRRDASGKGAARQLRRRGRVPAVFYGPNRAPTVVSVGTAEFERKLAHLEGSHLIRLLHPDPVDAELHEKMALLREMQTHPVTGAVLHADFYEVDLTKRLAVSVPLHFTGKAVGVIAGGILQPILREIELECLPTEIPDFIEVDVSPLKIHDVVHVSDLNIPPGVTVVDETTATVVTVLPPTVEEAPVAGEAAEGVPAEGAAAEGAPAEGAEGTPEGGKKGDAGKKGGGEE